jgi:CubicO group peptidase (beta-lactamase class C family)
MASGPVKRRWRAGMLGAAALHLCCTQPTYASVAGYDGALAAAPIPLPPAGPTSPAELEAFLDGVLGNQLRSQHAAGATVAIVKDGRLFFTKGYGYADAARHIPVDPEKTLFRIGSVSKLFTWTAVMQLVEQGKLDLDADVNRYLKDVHVPSTYGQPVTLRNLLTHTAGFEDGFLGYTFSFSQQQRLPLAEALRQHMPVRVRPPTTDFNSVTNCSYSNWGAALAGHIVATVSGVPFDEYVRLHIFLPLGMTSSTFREPLPAPLAARVSMGYAFENGEFVSKVPELDNFWPAGSVAATATDMARFMLAHLQDGQLGGARILNAATARLMHERAMSPDPAVNGMGLGFFETWLNGRRTIGHGGNGLEFTALLMLIPAAHLGLFVSYNTVNAATAGNELQHAFMDHYFPASLPQIKPPPHALQRNERYAGEYRTLRRSYTKIDKLIAAAVTSHVEAMPDGTLLFDDARWIEVRNGVFRRADNGETVAFKGGDASHARYLLKTFAAEPFEHIAWYEELSFQGSLLAIAALLFLTTAVSAVRRRKEDRNGPTALRWARPALAMGGGLLLGCVLGMALTVISLDDVLAVLLSSIPTGIYISLTLGLLAIVPVSAAVVFAALVWKTHAWTWGARVHYTAAVLAAVAFLWVLNYWNALGYHFG